MQRQLLGFFICLEGLGVEDSLKGTDGGFPRWGSEKLKLPKFCFGPQIVPKEDVGEKIGGTDAENHEESENSIGFSQKSEKIEISEIRHV